jgi:hypothetical protein
VALATYRRRSLLKGDWPARHRNDQHRTDIVRPALLLGGALALLFMAAAAQAHVIPARSTIQEAFYSALA